MLAFRRVWDAPGSLAEALHQRELRRLAQLQQQHAILASKIEQQLRRVAAAEKLAIGGGQQ